MMALLVDVLSVSPLHSLLLYWPSSLLLQALSGLILNFPYLGRSSTVRSVWMHPLPTSFHGRSDSRRITFRLAGGQSLWGPVLISLTVFFLGAGLGYAIYGRRAYDLAQPDPMERILGSDIYRILNNKYYIDEFYGAAFIRPMRWIATTFNHILDQGIIDGILHAVARGSIWVGNLFREFNRIVIDGVGDGIPAALVDAARSMRSLQTGHIQQYLLYTLIAFLWVGGNLVLLAVFPNIVGWAALLQAVVAVLLIVFFNLSSSKARG
jgi:NADH:ubiquinone oxidoreductase subunit 5 (subunit L)/multisubunit Na+/H+ antiporter MnhA subunit